MGCKPEGESRGSIVEQEAGPPLNRREIASGGSSGKLVSLGCFIGGVVIAVYDLRFELIRNR